MGRTLMAAKYIDGLRRCPDRPRPARRVGRTVTSPLAGCSSPSPARRRLPGAFVPVALSPRRRGRSFRLRPERPPCPARRAGCRRPSCASARRACRSRRRSPRRPRLRNGAVLSAVKAASSAVRAEYSRTVGEARSARSSIASRSCSRTVDRACGSALRLLPGPGRAPGVACRSRVRVPSPGVAASPSRRSSVAGRQVKRLVGGLRPAPVPVRVRSLGHRALSPRCGGRHRRTNRLGHLPRFARASAHSSDSGSTSTDHGASGPPSRSATGIVPAQDDVPAPAVGASGDVGRGRSDDRDRGPRSVARSRSLSAIAVASRCAAAAIGEPDGQLHDPAERRRAEPLPQRQLGVVEGGPVAASPPRGSPGARAGRSGRSPGPVDRHGRPARSPGRAAGTSAPRRARRAGSGRRPTRRRRRA